MRVIRRLRYWLHARREQADLAEELEFHKSMCGEKAEMGNMTLAREDARAVWIWPWLGSVVQDLRYAVRNLRAHPGFTLISILALGAAIGLNTSLFTVFNAIALRPWPVKDANRMVKIFSLQPRPDMDPGFSIPEYCYFAEHSRSFSGMIVTQRVWVHFGFEAFGKSTNAIFVDADHFRVLGVPMHFGRGFLPEENQILSPQPVVVLSYALWSAHFNSDPEILGKTVRVEDIPFIVVGIAPEDFLGTSQEREDAWFPFSSFPMLFSNQDWTRNQLIKPDVPAWMLGGRLADGVSKSQAQAEIDTLSRQWRKQFSMSPARISITDATMAAGPTRGKNFLPGFPLMFAGVTLIVLLACANVGNLLVARAAARQHEIEVRRSLGAGRTRIIRQLLTESFVLAFGAAALGVALAYKLPAFVISRIGEAPPVLLEPDIRVLGYALALAIIACFAFGLAPALHGTRTRASRARLPLRSVLLAAQVALSVTLLIGATLLLRGIQHLRSHDPGFSVQDISVVSIELPVNAYDRAHVRAFSARFANDLNQHPELQSAALTTHEPLNMPWGITMRLPNEDHTADRAVSSVGVSDNYFDVLRIPLVSGHIKLAAADSTHRSVVVNEALARRLWGDVNPVGKAFLNGPVQMEVTGVVRDSYSRSLDRIEPIVYQPFGGPPAAPKVLVRSTIPGAADQIAAIVKQIEPRARTQIMPLSANLERWGTASRIGAQLAGALGLFALTLATVGMAGVFAYVVQQRTQEIGIRMALGARQSEIIALVLSGTSKAIAVGLMMGSFAAIAAARFLTTYLYGVSPFDPHAYAIVAAILTAASLAAAFWPARRATKIDPMSALRCE